MTTIINFNDYKGVLPGLVCEWKLELRNQKTNKTSYSDIFRYSLQPDKLGRLPEEIREDFPKDCIITHNVYFEGYAEEVYDPQTSTIIDYRKVTGEELQYFLDIRDK